MDANTCICGCPKNEHDLDDGGLHGCHACRCFGLRTTLEIVERLRAEEDARIGFCRRRAAPAA